MFRNVYNSFSNVQMDFDQVQKLKRVMNELMYQSITNSTSRVLVLCFILEIAQNFIKTVVGVKITESSTKSLQQTQQIIDLLDGWIYNQEHSQLTNKICLKQATAIKVLFKNFISLAKFNPQNMKQDKIQINLDNDLVKSLKQNYKMWTGQVDYPPKQKNIQVNKQQYSFQLNEKQGVEQAIFKSNTKETQKIYTLWIKAEEFIIMCLSLQQFNLFLDFSNKIDQQKQLQFQFQRLGQRTQKQRKKQSQLFSKKINQIDQNLTKYFSYYIDSKQNISKVVAQQKKLNQKVTKIQSRLFVTENKIKQTIDNFQQKSTQWQQNTKKLQKQKQILENDLKQLKIEQYKLNNILQQYKSKEQQKDQNYNKMLLKYQKQREIMSQKTNQQLKKMQMQQIQLREISLKQKFQIEKDFVDISSQLNKLKQKQKQNDQLISFKLKNFKDLESFQKLQIQLSTRINALANKITVNQSQIKNLLTETLDISQRNILNNNILQIKKLKNDLNDSYQNQFKLIKQKIVGMSNSLVKIKQLFYEQQKKNSQGFLANKLLLQKLEYNIEQNNNEIKLLISKFQKLCSEIQRKNEILQKKFQKITLQIRRKIFQQQISSKRQMITMKKEFKRQKQRVQNQLNQGMQRLNDLQANVEKIQDKVENIQIGMKQNSVLEKFRNDLQFRWKVYSKEKLSNFYIESLASQKKINYD